VKLLLTGRAFLTHRFLFDIFISSSYILLLLSRLHLSSLPPRHPNSHPTNQHLPSHSSQHGAIVGVRTAVFEAQANHQRSILGFPRQGANRELKKATEAYWGDKLSKEELLKEGKRLRLAHWKIQKDAGVDVIPSNDFAYYDQVLDHIQLFGVIPERYAKYKLDQIDECFAMGRGLQKPAEGIDVPALVRPSI
jgi:hypothetical protein